MLHRARHPREVGGQVSCVGVVVRRCCPLGVVLALLHLVVHRCYPLGLALVRGCPCVRVGVVHPGDGVVQRGARRQWGARREQELQTPIRVW